MDLHTSNELTSSSPRVTSAMQPAFVELFTLHIDFSDDHQSFAALSIKAFQWYQGFLSCELWFGVALF